MLRLPVLAAVLAVVLVTPASAASLKAFEVRRAVVMPERPSVSLDLRCRSACSGRVRVQAITGDEIGSRRVRLPAGRTRRIVVRLHPDAMALGTESEEAISVALVRARSTIESLVPIVFRPACDAGRTLATSTDVRVFRVGTAGLFACERRGRRPSLRLAKEFRGLDDDSTSLARAAGSFAAFVVDGPCRAALLRVVDVRARRAVRTGISSAPFTDGGCIGGVGIASVVLRPSGAVAWGTVGFDGGDREILALDDAGRRLLDDGPDVDIRSLVALDGGRVGWRRAGLAREAPLG